MDRYSIYDAVGNPARDKKKGYEYLVEFEDQSIEFPAGTILYAGEDKWKKALPDSDIVRVDYYVGVVTLNEMINENKVISPETAEIAVTLNRDGSMIVDKKLRDVKAVQTLSRLILMRTLPGA